MAHQSRRDFVELITAAVLLPLAGLEAMDPLQGGPTSGSAARFRIRTITAGINLSTPSDLAAIEAAIQFLERAKRRYEAAGYEVQTMRIATQPLLDGLPPEAYDATTADLHTLDDAVRDRNVLISLGPVLTEDRYDPDVASWTAALVSALNQVSLSVMVASPELGVLAQGAATAAQAIRAIATATPGGTGNFRFAAGANILPGTPFFPVAYHRGPVGFSLGLESPPLVREAFSGAPDLATAQARLREILEFELGTVEQVAREIASSGLFAYLGIDASPAPGKDTSIAGAIESLTHVPFGSASTLSACAAVTDVLKNLRVRTCGYSGLMLPVLEDPVLATRATEGRYTLNDLLLYSSVCGTGLDVVPIPGDASATAITAVIRDVAALATKLQKPLSARLFPVPGLKAGDVAHFDHPFLTDAAVFQLD